MSTSIERQLEEIIDSARLQGWRSEKTTKGHLQFFAPNGKDIIVGPGTSCSRDGLQNFLSLMKKSGYTQTDYREQSMEKRKRGHTGKMVLEYLISKAPSPVDLQEVTSVINARTLVGISASAVGQALSKLCDAEKVKKLGRGLYTAIVPKVEFSELSIKKEEAFKLDLNYLSNEIDSEKELDAAVLALSRIEGVIKKHREIAKQLLLIGRLLNIKE